MAKSGADRQAWGAATAAFALIAMVLAFAALIVAVDDGGDGGGGGGEETTTVADGGTATTSGGGGGGGGGDGDVAAGEEAYAATCAACHGQDATGVPNLGKDLTASEFTQGLSDEEYVAFVVVGRGTSDPENTTGVAMPPKGGNPALSDEELANIVAYLRTLET